MTLLASESDVEARLRRPLTDAETDSVADLIMEASAMVEAWCGTEWTDVVPPRVTLTVSRMVARVFDVPATAASADSVQMTAGPYGVTRSYGEGVSSGGPWMTKADRLLLRAYRLSGGVFSVDMTS